MITTSRAECDSVYSDPFGNLGLVGKCVVYSERAACREVMSEVKAGFMPSESMNETTRDLLCPVHSSQSSHDVMHDVLRDVNI